MAENPLMDCGASVHLIRRVKPVTSGLIALLLLSVLTATAHAAGKIELDSPKDWQVFQRESRSLGHVRVRGHLDHGNGSIEIRWTGEPADGQLPAGWQSIRPDASGAFTSDITMPAGGWYALELRETGADKAAAGLRIDHVGIGEVFVVAGQSNSTNYGSEPQKPQSGMVSTFDGENWRVADDPQPGTQDRGRGGSFLPAFGDAMARRFHVPIGVACCGSGGTSVRQWLPKGERIDVRPSTSRAIRQIAPGQWECTGELYAGLLKRIRALGPHGFRALLWHQGESDAGQAPDRQITAERYRRLLEQIIRQSRKDARWDFPWFVAQATYHSPADPANPEFRAAQRAVCTDGLALPGPDTDALGPEFRHGVHFNPKGLQAHGGLWAQSVGAFVEKATGDERPTSGRTPTGNRT
jgi:hypothetical protein